MMSRKSTPTSTFKVLGIDPGLVKTGIGIIQSDGYSSTLLYSGVIAPDTSEAISGRLSYLALQLNEVIVQHSPDHTAIEDVFLGHNVQSTLKLGYARGVCLLQAHQQNKDICSYSPRQIKQAIVGNGSASKDQVQYMVKLLLNIKIQLSTDASDALAISLCHAHRLHAALKNA